MENLCYESRRGENWEERVQELGGKGGIKVKHYENAIIKPITPRDNDKN